MTIARERLLQCFEDLLRIDSPSEHEAKIAEHLAGELRALGLSVYQDEAGNVIGQGDGSGEPLLICAHMDTVEPTANLNIVRNDGFYRSDGTTILGADDKAGIAVTLEALRCARKRPPVDVVFTVEEETGLVGASELDLQRIRAKRGIVLDSGGNIGSVTTSAPSHYNFKATFIGKATHAGVAPEDGINAIVVAADAIMRMQLGRIDPVTTANVGIINGGQATNIVPDRVVVRGEIRSHNEETLMAQVHSIEKALQDAAAAHGAKVEIEIERSYTHFAIADDNPLVQTVMAGAAKLGLPGQAVSGGGGSDANIFNAKGLECINMSVGMASAHAKSEYIACEDIVKAAELLCTILEQLAS